MPEDPLLFYALPAKAYYQGQECRVVRHLSNGKVRITIIATGKTIDVRLDEVSVG